MSYKTTASLFLFAGITAASGQGLYNLATLDDEYGAKPLTYTAYAGIGYDDNVIPRANEEEEGTSLNAGVGASLTVINPTTSYDFYVKAGVIHYLDDIDLANGDTFPTFSGGFNVNHQVSERLRVVGKLFGSYQLEPDYSLGIANTRFADPYFTYGADVALGYRWTQRLGTYTGISYNGIAYDSDQDEFDRDTFSIYHDFRYQLSPQTVLTLGGRYSETSADNSNIAGDSENVFLTVGVEHRFSPTALVSLKAGVQIRDTDLGGDSTNPFFEGAYKAQINEVFAIKTFARYSVEDYGSSFGSSAFDELEVLRLGLNATYQVSPKLSLHGGVDYIDSDFGAGRNSVGTSVSGFDDQIVNIYTGFTYGLTDRVSINGSYNYTDATSSQSAREYDRNRVILGVSTSF